MRIKSRKVNEHERFAFGVSKITQDKGFVEKLIEVATNDSSYGNRYVLSAGKEGSEILREIKDRFNLVTGTPVIKVTLYVSLKYKGLYMIYVSQASIPSQKYYLMTEECPLFNLDVLHDTMERNGRGYLSTPAGFHALRTIWSRLNLEASF
jgi:hypothetical protein